MQRLCMRVCAAVRATPCRSWHFAKRPRCTGNGQRAMSAMAVAVALVTATVAAAAAVAVVVVVVNASILQL